MSDQDTVFSKTEETQPVVTPTTEATNKDTEPAKFAIPDPVKEYVGEGKKYASIEAALESDHDTLERAVGKMAAYKEVLEYMGL